jgi:hypothetical protein
MLFSAGNIFVRNTGSPPPQGQVPRDVDTVFQDIFKTNRGTRPEKLQALSLHFRMCKPLDQQTQALRNTISFIHSELAQASKKITPFITVNIDLEDSLKDTLDEHTEIRGRLLQSISNWKQSFWNGQSRAEFVKRQENGEKVQITRTEVLQKQYNQDLGDKYPDSEICFDSSTGEFVETNLTDLDHMDPWNSITNRVNEFLDAINNIPNQQVQRIVQTSLETNYGDFFKRDQGEIKATQYLAICLYNFSENLTSMNHYTNIKKNADEVLGWVSAQEQYDEAFVGAISMHSGTLLQDCVDSSGFILVLKNEDPIKPEYRGKGIGEALTTFTKQSPKALEALQKVKHESLKNTRIIQSTLRLMRMVPIPEQEKQQLLLSLDDLGMTVEKSGKGARNVVRKQRSDAFGETVAQSAGDQDLSSESSGDEKDREIKRLKIENHEKDIELDEKDTQIESDKNEIARLTALLESQEKES